MKVPTGVATVAGALRARAPDIILMLVSTLVALLVFELAYRIVARMPVLKLVDFRSTRAVLNTMTGVTAYDAELGWTLKANVAQAGFNTLEHGIRANHGETAVRTGGVLAVGDSFTAGSEVLDWESWPAHLEKLGGIPVLNGGIGGYGTDQIIMRAERLLPLVKPKTLIVGFLESDILRAGFSSYGRPKPWYALRDGKLVLNSPSVAAFAPEKSPHGRFSLALRGTLGYSAVADHLLSRLAPGYWYASETEAFRRIQTDEVGVTCALLERLKAQADKAEVRVLLFMQYGSTNLLQLDKPPAIARQVMDCAAGAKIQVVDEFPTLRAILKADPKAVRDYYVMTGEVPGHMSSRGNLHAAQLLHAALTGAPPVFAPPKAPTIAPGTRATPPHEDLLRYAASAPIATFSPGPAKGELVLTATGPAGEHYWGVGPLNSTPGVSTLTLEVRAVAASHVRVQLLDGATNGLLGDVDLAAAKGTTQRVEVVRSPSLEVADIGGGWRRVTLTAELPAANRVVRVQLMQGQGTSFAPKGEAIQLRNAHLR